MTIKQSYGVDINSDFRRLADYVAKVLNGMQPAELPVEQLTKSKLLVMLKIAKAIGLRAAEVASHTRR